MEIAGKGKDNFQQNFSNMKNITNKFWNLLKNNY